MNNHITCIFRSSLRVTSKATALEFYEGVKGTLLIDTDPGWKLRIEPGNLISEISTESLYDGTACFVPNLKDDDGHIAYRYRKYINAYLKGDE